MRCCLCMTLLFCGGSRYDARARKVLRRMAHWLSVPWPHVANLEAFLLSQMQSPLALSENPHTQSIEYRKQPSKAQVAFGSWV